MTERDRLFFKRMELIRDEDRLKIRVWEDEVKQGVFSKSDPTYTDFEEFHGWGETFYLVFKNPVSHVNRYALDGAAAAKKHLQFAGKLWQDISKHLALLTHVASQANLIIIGRISAR